MSAASLRVKAWRLKNPERYREYNRLRKKGEVGQTVDAAFAQRFGVSLHCIMLIGSAQLCRCKSDEARRILLRCTDRELAGKVAA